MFILVMLTQHVSSIIMLIITNTDYIKNCVWRMPATRKRTRLYTSRSFPCCRHSPHAVFYIVCSPDDEHNDARNMLSWHYKNKHLYLWHLVGFFISYNNDARSHEPKIQLEMFSVYLQKVYFKKFHNFQFILIHFCFCSQICLINSSFSSCGVMARRGRPKNTISHHTTATLH